MRPFTPASIVQYVSTGPKATHAAHRARRPRFASRRRLRHPRPPSHAHGGRGGAHGGTDTGPAPYELLVSRSRHAPRSRCAWSPRARAGARSDPRRCGAGEGSATAPTASAAWSRSVPRSAASRGGARGDRGEDPGHQDDQGRRAGGDEVRVTAGLRPGLELTGRCCASRASTGRSARAPRGRARRARLRQALVLHAELHREAEAAAIARADRDAHVMRALERPSSGACRRSRAPRRSTPRSRRRRGARASRCRACRAAHLLRHREIGLHHAVARLGVAVAPPVAVAVAVNRGLMVSMRVSGRKAGLGRVAEFHVPVRAVAERLVLRRAARHSV